MGIHIIKMPDIGEGIAEVELVGWHIKVGDTVVENQVLADVMTDKATVEIPSPVVGKVIALTGNVGDTLAVGSELIRFEVGGSGNVSDDSGSISVEKSQCDASVVQPVKDVIPDKGVGSSSLHNQPLASPALRKRARDLGVDLHLVSGSGSGGRIVDDDLMSYARQIRGEEAGLPSHAYGKRLDTEQRPIVGLRRKIAQKMQESKRRIPHFSYVEEIDVTELEDLRAHLNRKFGDRRGKLTMLPLLARAMVLALRDFPNINARYDDDAGVLTRYGAVHLGVATQTELGLVVPVVRHAETMDVWTIAKAVSHLASAVRHNKVDREALTGSTITLSSLGALGGIASTPVINYPEVAIVGVNRIVERPAFRQGVVVARKLMNLSSSFDHRVVDGMDAAQFIQSVRGLLEQPALLFVEP